MQSDILFDNIYIGHSIEDAEKLKAETYDIKIKAEEAEKDASKPKETPKPKSPSDLKFMDDPVLYVKEKVNLFVTIAKSNPVEAIRFVPEVAGGIGVLVVTLVAVVLGALGSGSSPPPQIKKAVEKTKESAVAAKDKVTEAASSGAEKVQTEVNKRTTRSSGTNSE